MRGKMSKRNLGSILAAAFVAAVTLMEPAQAAYVDPGSGSYFIQVAVAGLVGALFSLKLFWTKIKVTIAERFAKDGQVDEPSQHG
jgi:hypothetical protein